MEVLPFLASKCMDVLRLDAVGFTWKRVGTAVNRSLRCTRLSTRCAASGSAGPTVTHLRAIVGPGDTVPHFGAGEHPGKKGNLAYNSLTLKFRFALAARDARLMTMRCGCIYSLANATCATYILSYDDISRAVTDQNVRAVGLNGPLHGASLADFYNGVFLGSCLTGELFQHHIETGDKRSSGALPSWRVLSGRKRRATGTGVDATANRILMSPRSPRA